MTTTVNKWLVFTKISLFTIIMVVCSVFLIIHEANPHKNAMHLVPANGNFSHSIKCSEFNNPRLETRCVGAFSPKKHTTKNKLTILVGVVGEESNVDTFVFPIVDHISEIVSAKPCQKVHLFEFHHIDPSNVNCQVKITYSSNIDQDFAFRVSYDTLMSSELSGIIIAAIILVSMYVVIIFDVYDRTLASLLASTIALSVLAYRHSRPSMEQVMSWIDVETLLLLFCMMILVAIMAETGIFDYCAVLAFRITKGELWPLINYLCLITSIMAMFLDCVTTIMMLTPVVIRICEVIAVRPEPVLIIMLICCNMAGIATPIGDPPNMMIMGNEIISRSITFIDFTVHMSLGLVFAMGAAYVQLRFCHYRRRSDFYSQEIEDQKQIQKEIDMWRSAADHLSQDEDLMRETVERKLDQLDHKLVRNATIIDIKALSHPDTVLVELQKKFPIKDKPLLWRGTLIISIVLVLFFMHSFPDIQHLQFGWVALLGMLLLLILMDEKNIEHWLHHVEWSTLLFIGTLFVLMESLDELGLIQYMGEQIEHAIEKCPVDMQLTVAVILVLWFSAIFGAIVDNVPLTTMMIKIVVSIMDNEDLKIPLPPLVYALAFGSGLSGNGTLIGASSNLVCTAVAEIYNYNITFNAFTKIGLPVMLTTVSVITVYLYLCHNVFEWN